MYYVQCTEYRAVRLQSNGAYGSSRTHLAERGRYEIGVPMNPFAEHRPKSGWRQPRIRYQIGSAGTEDLEEIRKLVQFRGMNSLYLEALKIGARIILEREIHAPPVLSDEVSASFNSNLRQKESQRIDSSEVGANSRNSVAPLEAQSQTPELTSFAKLIPDDSGSKNTSDSNRPGNKPAASVPSRAQRYSGRQ